MSVNLSALAGAGQQFFDNNGVILSGGKLYSYVAGTTTPQATYTSASGSTPHTNPIILNSAGRVATGEIWLTAGENYKFSLFTSADVLIATWDNITGINGTGITSNAVNVEYDPAGTGAVATNVQTKLRESRNAVSDFGCDPTGVVNSTTKMLAFFNASIADGVPGHIPAGTYLITAGVLAFDNGHIDKLWPFITTDGYEAVTFNRADATDAPMISITNGTASSAVGNFWQDGSLGGITFDQNGKAKASNQHGLLLLGIVGTAFGHMRMNDSGGSCICVPEKLYSSTNPDPYNVATCIFDAAEANRCNGYAFFNNNGLGLTGCTIDYIRAIENVGGAFFGFGTANTINVISAGSCSGWALGNRTDSVGSAQRFVLGVAELDDMQYGIDMRRVSNSVFGVSAVRFVHRYNFGPFNPSGGYWPRIAVQGGTLSTVVMNNLRIIDRIEAGGAKADLGQFFDFGSSPGNQGDIQIQRQIIDNAGFGFTVADYYTNFNANSKVKYTEISGLPIIDTLKKTAAIARAPTTFAVPSGGYGGAGNTVQYSTELYDPSVSYDPATWTYTTRSPGAYRIAARIVLAVAIGTRIRTAIMFGGIAVVSRFFYATTANAQCYDIDFEANLAAGATININADQNTGGAVNLTTMFSINENTFFVTQI